MSQTQGTETGIAIIGMAGRFPGARNIDAFWRNLCEGVESVSFFSDEELAAAGAEVLKDCPRFVRARAILEDADRFDAEFFGVSPREAEILDPQHRVFLECAWEALESAACDPARFDGAIGVFAGMSLNTYLAYNLLPHPELMSQFSEHQLMLGNDKDFLATRVSYKLDLRGPSVGIQTACSTSLVAVCVACQNLLSYECDLALAGAVSILFPQKRGYVFQEGGITSPDGHCRAFDAKAAGTVGGEGVGIVVLKRLTDALANGDTVYAVIKGFATNNDGKRKAGYAAPSVDGQAEVIATAQGMAGFSPDTISYIEAHGTGTPLGDPIEFEGLTKAFRAGTSAKSFCAIGSVKTNIGHLDTASGVTGLIKCALALHHRKLPPSLHFESPNPEIDYANSPFYVNATLVEWKNGHTPRRAGVSSLGIGGTNAHVVLEEAPAQASDSRDLEFADSTVSGVTPRLLVISAKSESALHKSAANLAAHLRRNPGLELADVAYTLQMGRRALAHRRMLVCRDLNGAASELEGRDQRPIFTRVASQENPPVVFMFPGQGAQYVNMGRELYDYDAAFRRQVDVCCEVLRPRLGLDLRTILYPGPDDPEDAARRLKETGIAQPALFVVEYSLARHWMNWGVTPEAMIGHSLGEYVAACLAGVFSLDDALMLVAERGRMMQQLPAGRMLAIRLPEHKALPFLGNQLSLSAVNCPELCVAAGPDDAIAELQRRLTQLDVACSPLNVSHAFHSAMMDSMQKPFAELVGTLKLNAPRIPWLSNVTGTWIEPESATDPAYWSGHVRQTVRFSAGLGELFKVPGRVLLEVGPGQTLSSLAKQHPARHATSLSVSSLRHARSSVSELEVLLHALGQLWISGVAVDWHNFSRHERSRRVPLPTYPFEQKRFFIEPRANPERAPGSQAASSLKAAPFNGFRQTFSPSDDPSRTGESEDLRPRKNDLPRSASPASPETATHPCASRRERIVEDLRTLLHRMSGLSFSAISEKATLMEMGFDSLSLTRVSLAIEKELGVRVEFRQLLEELSTLDALAAHIESQSDLTTSDSPDDAQPAASDETSTDYGPATVPLISPFVRSEVPGGSRVSGRAKRG